MSIGSVERTRTIAPNEADAQTVPEFHPNPARWTVATAFIVTYIVAALIRSPLLFLMSSTCIAVVLIAVCVRFLGLSAVRCDLNIAERAIEGEDVNWVLTLTHAGRFPVFLLRICLEIDEYVQSLDFEEGFASMLLSGESITFSGRVRFELRGMRSVGTFVLLCEDALGLCQVRSVRRLPTTTRVIPSRFELRDAVDMAGSYASTDAARRSLSDSEGGEFRGIREYTPGDPLRRIHWKWTARLEVFRVIELEDERSNDLVICFDLDRDVHVGKGKESTIEVAVKIVASVAEHFVLRRHETTVFCATGTEFYQFRLMGGGSMAGFLDFLATVGAESEINLNDLVYASRGRFRADASVLLVSPAPFHRVEEAANRIGRQARAIWIDADSFNPEVSPDATIGKIQHRSAVSRVSKNDHLRTAVEAAL